MARRPSPRARAASQPVGVRGEHVLQPYVQGDLGLFVAQLNAQGQAGRGFVGPLSDNTGDSNLYVGREATAPLRLTYEDDVWHQNGSTMFDARGAAGWLYRGAWTCYSAGSTMPEVRAIFMKNPDRPARYSYALGSRADGPTSSGALLLDQLNAQGQAGFRYAGLHNTGFGWSPSAAATIYSNLYVREDGAQTTYQYCAEPEKAASAADAQSLEAFLDQHGRYGALLRAFAPVAYDSTSRHWIFERSSAQRTALDYAVEPFAPNEANAARVVRLNRKAQQGFLWIGSNLGLDVFVKGAVDPLPAPGGVGFITP